jgi:hypothetical protein
MVRVSAQGNANAFTLGDLQEAPPQVLPVRVTVDLDRLIETRGHKPAFTTTARGCALIGHVFLLRADLADWVVQVRRAAAA